MVALCRRCGRKPAATTDGYCVPCKNSEVRGRNLGKFGRRSAALSKILSGDIVG